MADKTSTSATLNYELVLRRTGDEDVKRTISFDTAITGYNLKANSEAFKTNLLGKWRYFFQPTGWRDSNVTEDAYECVAVNASYVSKTTTEFDI
jgi:hypothetical protein